MTSWSYSSFSTALSCLRKYKYVYVDKLTVDEPESADLGFGSAIHLAINDLLTGGDGFTVFEIDWADRGQKGMQYGRLSHEALGKLGYEFLRKFIKMHLEKYKLDTGEVRVYGEYRGIPIEGTYDFYGTYDGRKSLRDFKTSGKNYEPEKSTVALQLYLYAYLLRQTNPGIVIDTLGYTVFNKQGSGSLQDLSWEFRESEMVSALEEMANYVDTIQPTGKIYTYPKNYNSCMNYNRTCEFFNKCFPKEEK